MTSFQAEPLDVDIAAEEEEQVNLANALDLSESEEEEELEALINDFATQEEEMDVVCTLDIISI